MRILKSTDDSLAHRLIAAIMPLIKGSQVEVMSATADFEFTMTQLRMLFVLEHAGCDMAVNELAEHVGLSMAATGRAVDIVVRTGLLSRREDESDRRIKRIGLTESGRKAIVQIGQARRRAVESFVAKLDGAERAALDAAVATLGALTSLHLPLPGGIHAAPSCAVTPSKVSK
ncbi:MarR family transcriptional regulator [Rhodanobacter sp. A1T4]|uniref:MarR family winged helix-turn-helix transcriptional regulator n=1 Tax=Rhodanobacter sp. A1T4 TaxID=2723087 RepID=UPI0017D19363|nr:MarR family transcriptional regulator [Rhodanobacter sp. A1T4]MBB6245032.1 DNA-binding MarR family transcriptional regulator [Rhodanobacter sp. A1T4]